MGVRGREAAGWRRGASRSQARPESSRPALGRGRARVALERHGEAVLLDADHLGELVVARVHGRVVRGGLVVGELADEGEVAHGRVLGHECGRLGLAGVQRLQVEDVLGAVREVRDHGRLGDVREAHHRRVEVVDGLRDGAEVDGPELRVRERREEVDPRHRAERVVLRRHDEPVEAEAARDDVLAVQLEAVRGELHEPGPGRLRRVDVAEHGVEGGEGLVRHQLHDLAERRSPVVVGDGGHGVAAVATLDRAHLGPLGAVDDDGRARVLLGHDVPGDHVDLVLVDGAGEEHGLVGVAVGEVRHAPPPEELDGVHEFVGGEGDDDELQVGGRTQGCLVLVDSGFWIPDGVEVPEDVPGGVRISLCRSERVQDDSCPPEFARIR